MVAVRERNKNFFMTPTVYVNMSCGTSFNLYLLSGIIPEAQIS